MFHLSSSCTYPTSCSRCCSVTVKLVLLIKASSLTRNGFITPLLPFSACRVFSGEPAKSKSPQA
ncbi:Uncharacterised protein [Vibrio cholerae]|nr:Uncharacterised protein [Vibrio cholerae]